MQTHKEHTVQHRSIIKSEAEKAIGVIHPIHQKGHEVLKSVERVMKKHVSSDLVEHMQKTKEEVHVETKKLVKIMVDFQNKIYAI